jgi:GTP diphosphokinase / guanosine-3',5'-bis(diphosphate) 3'-diphosphatase
LAEPATTRGEVQTDPETSPASTEEIAPESPVSANGDRSGPEDTQPLPVLVFEADEQAAAPQTAPPSGRVRARLARFGTQRGSTNPVLEPLIKTVRATHPKADLRVVERAYETAERFHEGQKRRSGDPFITHPLAVATILAELGMTPPTLCAALLHDTIEDTPYTLQQLRQDFGDEVAHLVDGVTKLDKVKYGAAAQAETVRKMVVAMARDIRVLVIKLADRLHNMRTLRYVSVASAERTARETLEIYAPLAHRLGMNTLKWELEDLAFAALYPKMYDEIVRLVAERAPSRDEYLASVIEQVQGDLRVAKIKASVTGRPKHYYSIYQKMIVRGRDFTDIYDLVGIRILVETVRDCYGVLGTIHARWNPVPGRFKDFIAMPKFNMYQSLHTTVIGPGGKPVELQIRTTGMHRRAEYGIAAHWKYKEDPSKTGPRPVPTAPDASGNDMAWLRQLLDWQKETEDPGEFLESLRFDLNTTEVFVFTPKGDVIALPSGSTPVDFAYAVHTEVGHRCIGARVNGRLVPLESRLDNGDLVEIFTSKAPGAAPSRDWLTFVQSARARNKIRAWFSKERREEAIEKGKDAIARLMRKQNLPLQRLLGGESLMGLAQEMRYADVSALYAAVGEGHVSAQNIVARLVQALGGEDGATEEIAEATTPTRNRKRIRTTADPGVVVKGASDVWVKLAKCCTPVPGDAIVGFVTRGSGVSVHRSDCPNVGSLSAEVDRMVEVEWSPSASSVFLVAIQVEALDRSRLLSDVTRVLSDQHVNILSASVTTTRDRVALSRFTFEMGDPKHLGHILRAVRGVEGVFDAYRITSGNTN